MRSAESPEEPQHGGCRSFVAGGCLLALGAALLAFLAVFAGIVILVRLAHLVWSYL